MLYTSGKYQGHLQQLLKQEQGLSVDYDPLWIILRWEINVVFSEAATVSKGKMREGNSAVHKMDTEAQHHLKQV